MTMLPHSKQRLRQGAHQMQFDLKNRPQRLAAISELIRREPTLRPAYGFEHDVKKPPDIPRVVRGRGLSPASGHLERRLGGGRRLRGHARERRGPSPNSALTVISAGATVSPIYAMLAPPPTPFVRIKSAVNQFLTCTFTLLAGLLGS